MADLYPHPLHEADGEGSEDALGFGNESLVTRLRDRWELASVLNFLSVFEPVIRKELMPNGLIEGELINPINSLAQLHIRLLKGIPPRSKMLDGSDAWVTVLRKKLIPWWPWVAEGLMPVKPDNGEELRQYKELDPIMRLLILKVLCELRPHRMKFVSSSLNPYAASYIPRSKRGANHATISFENERTLKDLKSSKVLFSEAPFRSYATVAAGSTSRHGTNFRDKQSLDEEFQMNLEFLQMTYPVISYQSLAAVYLENKEDMEAIVEMLNQLEFYLDESLENLPKTLDIGDIMGGSGDSKLRAKVEPTASSSGNSAACL